MQKILNANLIAPCGINCGLCSAFLRDKNRCPGCNAGNLNKPKACVNCIIKNCEHLQKSDVKFCYTCEKYPCKRLKQLNKRYETKYNVHIFENLSTIKTQGMQTLLENEFNKWHCKTCNGIICMHKGFCMSCETKLIKKEQQ